MRGVSNKHCLLTFFILQVFRVPSSTHAKEIFEVMATDISDHVPALARFKIMCKL